MLLSNILYRANEKTSKKRKTTTEMVDHRAVLKEIIKAGDVPESARLIPKLTDEQVKVLVNENLHHVRIFDDPDPHTQKNLNVYCRGIDYFAIAENPPKSGKYHLAFARTR